MKAFVTAGFTPEGISILSKHLRVEMGGWGKDGIKLPPAQLARAAAGSDFLVVGYEEVTREVLEALPGLRAVACARGGVRASVDVDAATTMGIPVIYTPGRNAGAVADVAFGLMLAEARKITLSNHLIRNRDWERATWDVAGTTPVKRFKGPELAWKKIGIIGFGTVGKQLAQRARGFEMDILVSDPFYEEKDLVPWGAKLVTLETLMAEADFVVVACVLNEKTRGMISRGKIALMKPTAYFINPARGAIVDEMALYEALRGHKIAGAGLDVLIEEPINHDHPFLDLENVTITPHIGGASDDIVTRHSVMIARDIEALITGRRPQNVANPEVLHL